MNGMRNGNDSKFVKIDKDIRNKDGVTGYGRRVGGREKEKRERVCFYLRGQSGPNSRVSHIQGYECWTRES